MQDLIRISKNDSYEISVNKSKNYFLISLFGVWDNSAQLEHYIEYIDEALANTSPGFNIIIDLKQYRGSTHETVHLHFDAMNLALRAGLHKTAVVLLDNPILKAAIDYIFKETGISATYFKSTSQAEAWLSM